MKQVAIKIARIYITEDKKLLLSIVTYLQKQALIRGVTVLRAIEGYGDHKNLRSSSMIDLSLNLPLVVEFFDEPAKVMNALEHLHTLVNPLHITCWDAFSIQ